MEINNHFWDKLSSTTNVHLSLTNVGFIRETHIYVRRICIHNLLSALNNFLIFVILRKWRKIFSQINLLINNSKIARKIYVKASKIWVREFYLPISSCTAINLWKKEKRVLFTQTKQPVEGKGKQDKKMKEWRNKIFHFVSTCIPDISNVLDPHSRNLRAEAYKWENHPSEDLDSGSWPWAGIDCKFETKIF